MDSFDVLDSFTTGTYTVTRRPRATVGGDGVFQPGAPTTFTIGDGTPFPASVQPASGRDLLRLPEGRRSIETRVVYTNFELQTGGQATAFEADRIEIEGDSWEVQQLAPWRPSPESDVGYVRAIIQAANSQAGTP